MTPREARRERREAERKAKKLEIKKSRLAESHPLAAPEEYPEIQPRWNPELEDEFPREVQIRQNAMLDLRDLKAGRPIPPPGPSPGPFSSLEEMREYYLAKRNAAPVGDGHARAAETAKPIEPATDLGFVSHKRAETNRINAKLSTGPRSPEGKVASSRNSTKHGLASGQVIIPGEDPAAFEALVHDFLEEHQPATLTEESLVQEMAQSFWLSQRAIRLQNSCFTEDGVNEKSLSLFLRYFTTHNRAFHKALADLQRLQKERRKQERGFVSQAAEKPDESAGFVSQNSPSTDPEDGFVSQNESTAAAERNRTAKNAA